MDSGVDISMKNPYPFLTFEGFKNFSEADFVESTKEVIIDSKLDHQSLTNGLVLELWSLVEIQECSGKKPVAVDKISRRQFAEIIGCFIFKWSNDEEVTRDFIKKMANPRDFKTLNMKVKAGSISEHDVWERGSKLFSRVSENAGCKVISGEVDSEERVEETDAVLSDLMSAASEERVEQTGMVLSDITSTAIGEDNILKECLLKSKKTGHPVSEKVMEDIPAAKGDRKASQQDLVVNSECIEEFDTDMFEDQVEENLEVELKEVLPHLSKLGLVDKSNPLIILKNFRGWEPVKEDITNEG